MLNKNYRVQTKEIPKIARFGKKLLGEKFEVKVWFDDALETPRFAFVVSKKVSKKAVTRNTEEPAIFRRANYIFIIRNATLLDLKSTEIKELIISLLK
jgi:hypothetical protein